MFLQVSYKKKLLHFFFESLKSLKKGVRSGSESISQRYGSADLRTKMSRIPNTDKRARVGTKHFESGLLAEVYRPYPWVRDSN